MNIRSAQLWYILQTFSLVLKVSCRICNCGPWKSAKMACFIVFHEFRHGRIFSGCSPVNGLHHISADDVTCWSSYQHFGFVFGVCWRENSKLANLSSIGLLAYRLIHWSIFFCGNIFNKNCLNWTCKHFFVLAHSI